MKNMPCSNTAALNEYEAFHSDPHWDNFITDKSTRQEAIDRIFQERWDDVIEWVIDDVDEVIDAAITAIKILKIQNGPYQSKDDPKKVQSLVEEFKKDVTMASWFDRFVEEEIERMWEEESEPDYD